MAFEATVDNERLLAKLKREGKVPERLQSLTGFNLFQTIDEEGKPGFSVVLGPLKGGRRGRKPQAIPLSSDPDNQPILRGDRLHRADIAETDDSYEFVKPRKENTALRIIRTGLLMSHGGTAEDMVAIAASGRKLQYHGAFPLTADAANIVGEGLDIDVQTPSKVITDERFGRINNLVGVPRVREVTIEGVVGGPLLVGQIDGLLKIHELTAKGWKVYDVTDQPRWQQKFMDLASQDVVYLREVEAAAKRGKRDKVFKVVKPPADHPDAA